MTASIQNIIQEGIFFKAHFAASFGTLKNIIALNYGIPLPKGFHPALSYHKESSKKFDSMFNKHIKSFDYKTSFFYGGFSEWHRLYHLVNLMDYDNFYSESSFPSIRHDPHGLYDEDLFYAFNETIKKENNPSFNFIMTQSNHQPFIYPEDYKNFDETIFDEIKSRTTLQGSEFIKRLKAFSYADYSIGKYIQLAKREKYFKDTLFIFTADHTFLGTSHDPKMFYNLDRIPLVFYAPELMKEEFKGTSFNSMSNHLDILPSLISLITKRTYVLDSWGRNLFEDQVRGKNRNFHNASLSCLDSFCLFDNILYKKDKEHNFHYAGDLNNPIASKIKKNSDDYYQSGLQYLYQF